MRLSFPQRKLLKRPWLSPKRLPATVVCGVGNSSSARRDADRSVNRKASSDTSRWHAAIFHLLRYLKGGRRPRSSTTRPFSEVRSRKWIKQQVAQKEIKYIISVSLMYNTSWRVSIGFQVWEKRFKRRKREILKIYSKL